MASIAWQRFTIHKPCSFESGGWGESWGAGRPLEELVVAPFGWREGWEYSSLPLSGVGA